MTLQHTDVTPDLAQRLHQFEIVVRFAIRTGQYCDSGGKRRTHLFRGYIVGMEKFGLTRSQVQYCVGRARNFLWEVEKAEKRRNAAKTFSSSVIIRMPEPKTKAA